MIMADADKDDDVTATPETLRKALAGALDEGGFIAALIALYKYHRQVGGAISAFGSVAKAVWTYVTRLIDHNLLVQVRDASKKWMWLNGLFATIYAAALIYLDAAGELHGAAFGLMLLLLAAVTTFVIGGHAIALGRAWLVKPIDTDRIARSERYLHDRAEYEAAREAHRKQFQD